MEAVPLVSICCQTYNHVDFIEKALESFLMQETNFDFEILLRDDASTDGTAEICKRYVKKYPDIINLLAYNENQFKKGVRPFPDNVKRAKGKYIALCEGDDYWTDPLKLQKQVDFLEKNQSFGFVCGEFVSINHITGVSKVCYENMGFIKPLFSGGIEIDIKMFWENWCIQFLTVMFRRELYNSEEFLAYNHTIDVHYFYSMIKKKKGFYIKNILGVQNVTEGGVYSHKSILQRKKTLYHARREIYKINKDDKYLKAKFFNVASELFIHKRFIRSQKALSSMTLFTDMIIGIQSWNDLKHIVKCVLFPSKMIKKSKNA